MVKVDEKLTIPISWAVSVIGAIVVSAIAGTFWVASVNQNMSLFNQRLVEIEKKLGIPTYGYIQPLDDKVKGTD